MTSHSINDLSIYPELLKKNGYLKVHESQNKSKSFMECWSKPISNEYGTAYLITFNFFDNSVLFQDILDGGTPYSWEAQLKGVEIDDNLMFSFRLLGTKQSLDYVEDFFQKMFRTMELPNENYYSSDDYNLQLEDIKKNKAIEDAVRLELGLPPRVDKKLLSNKNKI